MSDIRIDRKTLKRWASTIPTAFRGQVVSEIHHILERDDAWPMPYLKAWVKTVLAVYPEAEITQIGPLICAMRVKTGPNSQVIVSRYDVKRGTWTINSLEQAFALRPSPWTAISQYAEGDKVLYNGAERTMGANWPVGMPPPTRYCEFIGDTMVAHDEIPRTLRKCKHLGISHCQLHHVEHTYDESGWATCVAQCATPFWTRGDPAPTHNIVPSDYYPTHNAPTPFWTKGDAPPNASTPLASLIRQRAAEGREVTDADILGLALTPNAPTPNAAPLAVNAGQATSAQSTMRWPHGAGKGRLITDPSEALEETLKALNPKENRGDHGS